MLPFLLAFQLSSKAHHLLSPHPRLQRIASVRAEGEGKAGLWRTWERVKAAGELWGVELKVGWEAQYAVGRKEVTVSLFSIARGRRAWMGELVHEAAHAVLVEDSMRGELLPMLAEVAATDTLYDRVTDDRLLLPLLLPFLEGMGEGKGHTHLLWEGAVGRMGRVLERIAPPEAYTCPSLGRGWLCMLAVKEALERAYQESWQGSFNPALFEERALLYLRGLKGRGGGKTVGRGGKSIWIFNLLCPSK